MTLIISPANPRISRIASLHTTRGRSKHGLFLMEGPHLLETLLDSGLLPEEVYYHKELLQRTPKGRELLERLLATVLLSQGNRLIEVSERVMEALSEVQASQGVVSVLAMAAFQVELVAARRPAIQRPVLLILDDIADPGNMGTILRTALAADVEGVLLTPRCVDCYNPKVVRSAAGAHIALPIETELSWEAIEQRVRDHSQGRVFLAEAGSVDLYYKQNLVQPFALIIGNEAHGPSQAARSLATLTITVPLANSVESLNAAMAAGIILYEAVRQRNG
jgi:TrmH family RNA methyltransferase